MIMLFFAFVNSHQFNQSILSTLDRLCNNLDTLVEIHATSHRDVTPNPSTKTSLIASHSLSPSHMAEFILPGDPLAILTILLNP